MASKHWGLKLINGPDLIRAFQVDATYGVWQAGDILTLDASGHLMYVKIVGTSAQDIESAIAGVALTDMTLDANAETNFVYKHIHVISPAQVWSIKVEDGYRANDYVEGVGYELGYYGTSTTAYDIGYASGETARTVTADDFYYLDNTEHASAGYGGVVVAMPERGQVGDADYGGRVHIRFGPLACMLTQG